MPRKSKGKIIVVEDSEFVRQAIVHLLATHGFVVGSAEDGQEAYELICSSGESYFVLITDLDMPRMRGDELIEALNRSSVRLSAYIVISAHTDDHPAIAQLRACHSQVPLFFLPKPFDVEKLLQLLDSTPSPGAKGSSA